MDEREEIFFNLMNALPDEPDGHFWSNGTELLCKNESDCEAIADLFEAVLVDSAFDVHTGYYDPEEDKKSGEVDRYTGWYYIEVD